MTDVRARVHGIFCMSTTQVKYFVVFRKVFTHFFCLIFTFFVTLSNFPSVAASVKPMSSGTVWTDKYFQPVACFLFFNLGDFTGRWMPSKVSWPDQDSPKILVCMTLSRAVFFFFFSFCNAQPRVNTEPLFTNDLWYMFFMLTFAWSNGYISTLAIKYSPQFVKSGGERELAGKIMAFSMALGLALGAAFSFVTVKFR